jgi:hypothetical protein
VLPQKGLLHLTALVSFFVEVTLKIQLQPVMVRVTFNDTRLYSGVEFHVATWQPTSTTCVDKVSPHEK